MSPESFKDLIKRVRQHKERVDPNGIYYVTFLCVGPNAHSWEAIQPVHLLPSEGPTPPEICPQGHKGNHLVTYFSKRPATKMK